MAEEQPNMIDLTKRPPRNSWTRDQRIILCLLHRFYNRDSVAFRRIFNSIFGNELMEHGLINGMPFSSLNTQWDTLRRHDHADWLEVHVQTPFDRDGFWSNGLDLIEYTANELGISLSAKGEDDVASKFGLGVEEWQQPTPSEESSPVLDEADINSGHQQLLGVNLSSTALETVDQMAIANVPGHQTPSSDQFLAVQETVGQIADINTPSQRPPSADQIALATNDQSSGVNSRSLEDTETESITKDSTTGRTRACAGRPCAECHGGESRESRGSRESQVPPERTTWPYTGPGKAPPLLYRWSNVDSAGLNSKQYFVAGLFYPDVKLKYPDEYSQEEFKKMVVNHVRIDKVPTPFISTFITPLSPIHRAFKNREGAIVTIIDPAKLQTPFFFAKAFVFNLEIRQGKYCGVGEYLIWGKVPSQAIVASFKISDLERIAADHGDIEDMLGIGEIQRQEKCDERLRRALSKGPGRLDSNSGFIVGKLLNLLGIPQSHGELVAEKIVSSWRLRRTGSWENFKSGLNSAFAASFGLPSPLPSSQSNMSGVLGGDEVHGDEVDVDVVDVDELDADWSSGDYVMVHNESEEHF